MNLGVNDLARPSSAWADSCFVVLRIKALSYPGLPDTFNDMMCSGGIYAADE